MGETLAEATQHATDPASEQPDVTIVHEDWRDIERRIRLNTPRGNDQDCGPLRPSRPAYVGSFQVQAGRAVRVDLPAGTRTVEIFNETAGVVRRAFVDTASGGAGSIPIPPGEGRSEDVWVDYVYIWSTDAAGINDGSANGITVEAGV